MINIILPMPPRLFFTSAHRGANFAHSSGMEEFAGTNMAYNMISMQHEIKTQTNEIEFVKDLAPNTCIVTEKPTLLH